MSAVTGWRRYTVVTVDWQAALLAVLLVGVTVGAVAMVPWLQSPAGGGVDRADALEGTSAGEQAAGGVGWAVAEAGFAALLLGLVFAVRRLPEFHRKLLKSNLKLAILLFMGAVMYVSPWPFTFLVGLALLSFTFGRLVDHYDLFWLVYGAFGLLLAAGVAAVGGVALGVPFVLVGLVGLSIYDHYFANEHTWMFTLAASAVRYRLPVLVFVPTRWRLDWDRLLASFDEEADEDSEDLLAFGIGTADLALPAMLAAAVTAYGGGAAVLGLPVAVWGLLAGVGVAAFRLRYIVDNGGGAGLPSITAGCAIGLAVGVLLSGVPVAVALGVA